MPTFLYIIKMFMYILMLDLVILIVSSTRTLIPYHPYNTYYKQIITHTLYTSLIATLNVFIHVEM